METFDTNEEKSALIKKTALHREELEEEMKLLSERTEKIITNALIIGGAFAASYIIYRQLSGKKTKKKIKTKHPKENGSVHKRELEIVEEQTPSLISSLVTTIGTTLATQASAFLLSMAREKLAEYLQQHAEKKPGQE